MTAGERSAWLAARRKGITGTDVGAILGLNPWWNALDVYLDKTGEAMPRAANAAMWWGSYLEDGMARRYGELAGLKRGELARGTAMALALRGQRRMHCYGSGARATVLIVHAQHPFLQGTPDALVPGSSYGVEFKTAGEHALDEWGEPGSDQVPVHYLVQCAFYMAVTGMERWKVAALLGAGARISGDVVLYHVERNRALEAEVVDAAVRFWREHVEKRIPPAIDGSGSWQAYLAKKYARGTGVVLQATAKIAGLAQQYRDTQRERQALEADEMKLRNLLAAELKSADKAKGAFGTVGWVRPGAKDVTDWQAVAQAAKAPAALIARHTTREQNQAYLRAWWNRT